MKKILLLFIISTPMIKSFAQTEFSQKKHLLGISFFLSDFQAASEIRSIGLGNVLKSGDFFLPARMNPGLAINYLSGINKHFDFIGTLGGSYLKYPIKRMPILTSDSLLVEITAGINYKIISDKHLLNPFINLSIGASKYQNYYGGFIPIGVGLQVNFQKQVYLLLNAQYRASINENTSDHFYYSLGVFGNVARKKKIVVKSVPLKIITDRDGDGIVDSIDACPNEAGLAMYQGCPDRDNDGIIDSKDKCPDIPGVARFNGCPIPDRDHDGINDEEDECPDIFGSAKYQGCPIPDRDKDGVSDDDDKCPDEPGLASNFGCPLIDSVIIKNINKAAQNIFFETGSATLLPKSFKSMNEVVEILKEHSSYKIDINGYTDNVGTPKKNQKLSEKRTYSVKQFLQKLGINEARIDACGHGINDPVGDNKTAQGRAKNRRVELALKNY